MDKVKVLNRVYASSLPSRAKTVMFYLVNRSNKELTCFPAIPTIAKETGLSERTVQRALKELCEEGYIEKSPRYRENGGQSSNLYMLLDKVESNTDETVPEVDGCIKGDYGNERTWVKAANCRKEMKNMDFSFFDTVLLDYVCHRDGDSCVPP